MTRLEMETDFGTIIAEYKGGTYIHFYYETLESTPFDLISVFDYAAGKPAIANKPEVRAYGAIILHKSAHLTVTSPATIFDRLRRK